MSARNDGGPFHPMPENLLQQAIDAIESAQIPDARKEELAEQLGVRAIGVSMRDYFAAHAMQGLLTRPGAISLRQDAEFSYLMADAMLNARDKQ